jgi:tetratricopeptide (TPR) repeat protein
MMLTHKRRKSFYIIIGIFGLVFFINSATLPPLANAQRRGAKNKAAVGNSPEQLFSRGFFYLNNNNVTDKAADEFKRLMSKYPHSQEAQKAQFFLGSYYQRKYNILSQRGSHLASSSDLYKARDAFRAYIDKYPNDSPCECLADAYFNLSLVLKQLGANSEAGQWLDKLKGVRDIDSRVYIYQIVWSSSSKDIIDSHFDTGHLGNYAYTISGRDFDTFIMLMKSWCRSEKSRG